MTVRVSLTLDAATLSAIVDGRHGDPFAVLGPHEVQGKLIVRAFEAELAERLAERRIGFGKRLAANGKGFGQGFAHADLLRTLSRKNECNHWCGTAATAISRSTC